MVSIFEMKFLIVILLFTGHLVVCDEDYPDYEGASCTTFANEAGVCRNFDECEYAKNLFKNRKKIKNCFYESGKRFVCCVETITSATKLIPTTTTSKPIQPKPAEPITDRAVLFKEGRLTDQDIDCRFNGTFPVKCCRVAHDFTNLDFNEPPNCPELEKPYAYNNLSPHQSVIYDACYAYSRLGSKCLVNDVNTDTYVRDDCQRFRSITKISDGDPAKYKEFPHMAVTGGKKAEAKKIEWFGGGTLINEYFILTAAHALGSNDFGPVNYALLGTIYKNDTRTGELYHVVKRIRHPQHDSYTKKNDIGLLKVHTRVRFSEFIRPACLTFPGSKISEQAACTVAGWGDIGNNINTSDILLKATVYQEYDHNKCRGDFKARAFKWISDTMICAKSKGTRLRQDTCKGDSGGPLMTMSNRYVPCSYFVAGIVAWGVKCAEQLFGSYTNASYDKYQEWIVENVWPLQLNARKINFS